MKILIAGMAKTGTTGLLYLIANSMKEQPRLLFEPRTCPPDVQTESGDVVAKVIIDAKLNSPSFSRFEKKITIFRDPRDRIVSALLYAQYHANYVFDDERVHTVHEILREKESGPAGVPIGRILDVMGAMVGRKNASRKFRERFVNVLSIFDDYVMNVPDGFLYKYEDFVSEKYRQLEAYLGFPLTGAAEVPEILGRVARTKGHGDWRNWFTESDVRDYRPVLAPWLEKYGYDADDWALNPAPAIEPEHCSEYFMRLVREQRANKSEQDTWTRQQARILRIEPRLVSGWAIGTDPAQPIRVALLVNGNEVAQDTADRLRKSLQVSGIHPTGKCGFVFRFKPGKALRAGDRVSITPVSADDSFEGAEHVVTGVAANG